MKKEDIEYVRNGIENNMEGILKRSQFGDRGLFCRYELVYYTGRLSAIEIDAACTILVGQGVLECQPHKFEEGQLMYYKLKK